MKKIVFCLTILSVAFMLSGCIKQEEKVDVADNMSEITNIYFAGRNGGDRASISIGEREEPYILDGVHQPTCEFSLIVLMLENQQDEDFLTATLSVNGEEKSIEMEYNPIAHAFMYDLGYNLKDKDDIKLTYGNKIISFSNESENFAIDSIEAIEIAKKRLIDEISDLTQNGKFEGECYLKVLGESGSDFKELFWAFTIVDKDGENYNIIISAKDGTVLAED